MRREVDAVYSKLMAAMLQSVERIAAAGKVVWREAGVLGVGVCEGGYETGGNEGRRVSENRVKG